MKALKRAVALMLALVIFGACSQRTAESYASVGDLSEALEAEDVGCEELESQSSAAELVEESGRCDIDGASIEIFLFKDAKQRDGWLEFGGRLRPATATGPNWAIIGDTTPVSEAAEALGADLRE